MTKLDYSTRVTTIDGEERDLAEYAGKVLLIVNTASKCGFTPQYAGLETLWQDRQGDGLVILGFPCNQFGSQEPGTESDIQEFCQINYGVTFPMHAKVDVNGADTHPLFQQLKMAAPGLLGSTGIKWNFTKFLVGADGEIVRRYGPRDTPQQIGVDIEEMLRAGVA